MSVYCEYIFIIDYDVEVENENMSIYIYIYIYIYKRFYKELCFKIFFIFLKKEYLLILFI